MAILEAADGATAFAVGFDRMAPQPQTEDDDDAARPAASFSVVAGEETATGAVELNWAQIGHS